MKIMLSTRDRAFIFMNRQRCTWGGGEDGLISLFELGRALRLDYFKTLATDATPVDSLSPVPEPFEVTPAQAELTIRVLAQPNNSADVGENVAPIVINLRRQITAATAAAEKKGKPK